MHSCNHGTDDFIQVVAAPFFEFPKPFWRFEQKHHDTQENHTFDLIIRIMGQIIYQITEIGDKSCENNIILKQFRKFSRKLAAVSFSLHISLNNRSCGFGIGFIDRFQCNIIHVMKTGFLF
jgi:hypothetical protein